MAPYPATLYPERVLSASHDDNPASAPSLLANLVARVSLSILGTLLCWVPLRVLVRKGELAAVVLIATVCILNVITVVNSLLWPSDDYVHWLSGRGLCDVEVYLLLPLDTTYAAAVFALVRRLAGQVRVTISPLANANLGARDMKRLKRRALLAQAAVIFTIPIVQAAFTWFDLAQRFIVGTLVGCSAVYDNSWPKILVFDSPPTVFTLASVVYVYITYSRYRAISQVTRHALGPRNTPAAASASRTRRRLYNMCLAILAVYLPLQVFFLVTGVKETISAYHPYNYSQVHSEKHNPGNGGPAGDVPGAVGGNSTGRLYPWSAILFVPSRYVPGSTMYQAYIPIITTVVIFFFFGRGQEALEIYKRYTQYIQVLSPRRWWSLIWIRNRRQDQARFEEQGMGSFGNGAGVHRLSSVSDDTKESPDDYGALRRHGEAPRRHVRDIFPESAEEEPARPRRARTSHRHTHSYTNAARSSEAEPRPSSASSALSARSSPLESAAVIRPMIPERRSSLRNNTGFRRFRISNLTPSLTLSTLSSLPSVMSSLGRRGKEKGGEGKSKGSRSKKGGSKKSEDQNAETTTKTATATENTATDSDPGIEMRTLNTDMPNRDGGTEQDQSQEAASRSSGTGGNPDPPPAPILRPVQPALQIPEDRPRVGSPARHRVEERQPSVIHHSMSASIVQSDTASAPSSSVLATRSGTSVPEPSAPPRRRSGPRTQVAPPEGRIVRIGQPGLVPALWNGATVPTALPDLIRDSSTDRDTQPTPPPRFDPSIHSMQARPFVAHPMEYLPGYLGRETVATPQPTTPVLATPGVDRVRLEEERVRQQEQQARPRSSLVESPASRARAQRARERRRGFARPGSTPTATAYHRPPSTTMVHPAFRHGVPQGIDNNRWRDSAGASRPVSGQSLHQYASSRPQSRPQLSRYDGNRNTDTGSHSDPATTMAMGFFSADAVEGNPNVTITADGQARVAIVRDNRDEDEGATGTGAHGGSINSMASVTSMDGSDSTEIGVAVPLALRMSGARQVRASVVTTGNRNGGGTPSPQPQH